MAPIGTLHTLSRGSHMIHPRSRLAMVTAAMTGQELIVPDGFEFGKTNKTPEYLSKFPLGKVPSFESADGFLLTEGNAIAYYIADKASPAKRDQLLGSTPEARAKVQQWVNFATLHLDEAIGPLLGWRIGFGQYNEEKEKTGAANLKRWLDYTEEYLKGRKWLLDEDKPTMADLAVSGPLAGGFSLYIDAAMRKEYPEIVRWYSAVIALPELKELYSPNFLEARKEPPSA